MDKLFHW